MILEKYVITKDPVNRTITIRDTNNNVMVLFVEEAEFAIKAADQFLNESVESRGRLKYNVVIRDSFIHAFDQRDSIVFKHELSNKTNSINALQANSVSILKERYGDFREEMISCITTIKSIC